MSVTYNAQFEMTYYITLSKHCSEEGNFRLAKNCTRLTGQRVSTGQGRRAAYVEQLGGEKNFL